MVKRELRGQDVIMNLPNPEDAVPILKDAQAPLLEDIMEFAGLLQMYARHIEDHASVGDLVGLGYATRSSWTYMKTIRDLVKVLLPEEKPPEPEADRLEPVEPGDDVVPWIEENGA